MQAKERWAPSNEAHWREQEGEEAKETETDKLRKELAQKEAMMARLETERGVAGLRAELDAALAVRPRYHLISA